jgi:hypothetical protein
MFGCYGGSIDKKNQKLGTKKLAHQADQGIGSHNEI